VIAGSAAAYDRLRRETEEAEMSESNKFEALALLLMSLISIAADLLRAL
jgi:hypothetical protein